MQEAKKTIINVVTWNGLAYLPNFFVSLDEQTYRDFTVSVVDNASDDGTLKWLENERPDTALLRNFKNQGFSRANNQAITLALSRWPEETWKDRYILIANQDLELAPDCLRQLVAALDADPSLAGVQPKLLQASFVAETDGTRETERGDLIDSVGIVLTKARRAYERGAGESDRGQYDVACEVFSLTGALAMYRASALAEAKLAGEYFDEDFGSYKEDIDLGWRMRRLGMRVSLVPGAVAWHHRSAPSARQGLFWLKAFFRRFKKPKRINFGSTRNHCWLTWKNDELVNRLVHAPWIVPYEASKLISYILTPSSFKAVFAAWGGYFKMKKKREELKKRAKVSGLEMRKWYV
ncbi:MAG: glycosyltransferase family 2 protein [Patescibacteria group bacterium]|nr:glycosyltransferase family 2 protein [Patescibacteria group bacterium]